MLKTIKLIALSVFFAFSSLFAIFLFIGYTRVDVTLALHYKWLRYKQNIKPNEVPSGSSHLKLGGYCGICFIYKGPLPTPDKKGVIRIKNDCEANAKNQTTPHYYTVCLPEYGIVPEEVFTIRFIKPVSENVHFISGSTYDHFLTTFKE